MKILFSLLIFLFVAGTSFCQSQTEMNHNALLEYIRADKELNDVYMQVLRAHSRDTAFTKNLKASQRIWIQFRDAELKVKFPSREPGYYGSIFPYCEAAYKAELTNERVKTLKQWIEGVEEGDGCSGSLPMKK